MRIAASGSALSAAFLAAAAIIVVCLGLVSTISPHAGDVRQTRVEAPATLYASNYNSSLGLVLQLYLNPSTAVTGAGIGVRITVRNTTPKTNDLGLPTMTPLGLQYYPCGPDAPPIGVFFFVGYLDSQNVSTEASLPITEPSPPLCQKEPTLDHFAFAPLSSNVSLYTKDPVGQPSSSTARPFLNVTAQADLNVSGFWTGFDFFGYNTGVFHQLTPGVYTVVGLDPWGQLAILHFRVLKGWSPQTCPRQDGPSIEPECDAL